MKLSRNVLDPSALLCYQFPPKVVANIEYGGEYVIALPKTVRPSSSSLAQSEEGEKCLSHVVRFGACVIANSVTFSLFIDEVINMFLGIISRMPPSICTWCPSDLALHCGCPQSHVMNGDEFPGKINHFHRVKRIIEPQSEVVSPSPVWKILLLTGGGIVAGLVKGITLIDDVRRDHI